jgi:hypothetical protein
MKLFARLTIALALLATGIGLAQPPLRPLSDLVTDEGVKLPWIEDDRETQFYGQPQYQYYPQPQMFAGPAENRGEEYRKYLKTSVRLRNGNIVGSGTICHYDADTNTAYIISCGHLFRGGEKAVLAHCFYKNNRKLDEPAEYTATVLGYDAKEDLSFMTFKPDWELDQCSPIAPENTPLPKGATLYSCGCDRATETACYLMRVDGMGDRGRNLWLRENGPRHGRSGGGLLAEDGRLVGVCWGSTDPYNGTGVGKFVPLNRIHPYAKKAGLARLLIATRDVTPRSPARLIPIIDRSGPQGTYPKDYIPLP